MPSAHRHKLRQIRLPDSLWDAFKADCTERGQTPTKAIAEMIAQRLKIKPADLEKMMLTEHDAPDAGKEYTKKRWTDPETGKVH